MSLSQQEWSALERMDEMALKERVFSIFQDSARAIQERDADDPAVLGVIPRLAALMEDRSELNGYKEAFSALARSVGLWNYIDKEAADARDQIVAEAVTVDELDGITLHREQIGALNTLLAGRNLVLSAPTSFGKSILIDALLASNRYRRVAIVLPTIALLDEFRRRLTRRFGGRFSIVMYHSQVPVGDNVIFLGTQERLLNRGDLGQLDLAVVDEFYKLDPTRQDDRSLTLNAAVYQLLRRSKQFFFLGPNIETVRFSSDSRWRFEFLRTRFSTVAVDTYDLHGIADKDKEQRLLEEIQKEINWPALVFVSAPDRANKLAAKLASAKILHSLTDFSEWIDENFGVGWELSKIVRAGFGVHHGRIPRALASHFVRLFNTGELPVLICTSTLIEGVNTAAKSVLIYDKKINRRDYDFFTFSNIRGRAGRLGQHHVGSVYLFHSPPDQEAVAVEPPLFGDLDKAPDELVVHVSDEHISPVVNERVDALAKRLDLTPGELRLASSVGLEDAIALKQFTEAAHRRREPIHWHGYPDYNQINAVCQIICKVRRPNEFGARSASQLTFFLNDLRSRATMKTFFHGHSSTYRGEPSARDEIFRFLRACEYGLPQLFSVVELFAARLNSVTNYSLITAEMPRWFRPEVLKNLDEQGVPVQISERFYREGESLEELIAHLVQAATSGARSLSDFERFWVLDALPSQGAAQNSHLSGTR
jgi:hypothetical protein